MLTVVRFLIGRRDAILTLAGDPRAFWLSIALVMTAALARRYDQTYFPADPKALFMPLLVSAVNATILVVWWRMIPARGAPRPAFPTLWRRIVTLFWMTAPLAWLYGIPWERMFDPLGAVKANAVALLVVSVWRVALTARFLSVLGGVPFVSALCYLMFFADLVAVVMAFVAPQPLVGIMAGIEHSPADAFIADVNEKIRELGILTLPIWFFAAFVVAARARLTWPDVAPARVHSSAWAAVVVGTLLFCVPMTWTQPEQRLANRINSLLLDERFDEALDLVSSADAGDLPPHFDPLPREWFGQGKPDLSSVVAALGNRPDVPERVRRLWLDKLWRRVRSNFWYPPEDPGVQTGLARALVADVEHREDLDYLMRKVEGVRNDEYVTFHRALKEALRTGR